MRTKLSVLAATAVGFALYCLAGPASAVEIGASGQGQALIFPYYNAVGSSASVISVSHGEPRYPTGVDLTPDPEGRLAAVQVAVPLEDGGRELFIVYLPDGATWTAAIIQDGVGGVEMATAGSRCTHPALFPLGGPGILGVAPTGHIEVFALGELPYTDELAVAALPAVPLYRETNGIDEPDAPNDCAAISAAWTNGVWSEDAAAGFSPPRNTLSGSLQIIDLQRGIGLSTTTVALAGFTDQVLHRDLDADPVDWADVHPARSRVMTQEGAVESNWAQPVDAVTAVLMADATVEFWEDSGMALTTDLVVTLPTRPLYGETPRAPYIWSQGIEPDQRPRLDIRFVDRAGRPHEQIGPAVSKSSPKCSPVIRRDGRLPLDSTQQVLAQSVEASIDPAAVELYDTIGFDGCFEVVMTVSVPEQFGGRAVLSARSDPLVSDEGHAFQGVPGIVTALARAQNSFEGKWYGFQLPGTRKVSVEVPQSQP